MITALIVGGGSIGKRHLKNLLTGGHSAAVVETRADRRAEIGEKFGAAKLFTSLDEAIAAEALPDGVHLRPHGVPRPAGAPARAREGVHILMEKPVSHNLDGVLEVVETIERAKLVGMIGFCMRFFKPLMRAKELIDAGRVGRIVTARSFTGVHLPLWHPWEDYRTFYMAKKEQGGGVLLDEDATRSTGCSGCADRSPASSPSWEHSATSRSAPTMSAR